ncbi:MAG: type II secretion system protein [Phycisphaerae bacterium]|nr:type II secretion system protein [Phycisphaerae bacterium]
MTAERRHGEYTIRARRGAAVAVPVMAVGRVRADRPLRCSNAAPRWVLPTSRRGFTLVESVLATLVVGLTMVAALNTVGASSLTQRRTQDRDRAMLLARSLMAEIVAQAYEEPAMPAGGFGQEAGEAATGNRTLYDDVDDYHNWSASPPEERDGTAMTGFERWTRAVIVQRVSRDNLDTLVGTDSGVKRITVTVSCDGVPIASLQAVRARVWQRPAALVVP